MHIDGANKEDVEEIRDYLKYIGSIKLFIDGDEIINKEADHFIKDGLYYEGVENKYMAITKKFTEEFFEYCG